MNNLIICLPIVAAVGLFLARMVELRAKRDTVAGQVQEKLTLQLFVLTGFLIQVGSIVEYLVKGLPFSWFLLGAGLVVGLLSFAIRRRAIAALGRFWSLHVEIRENHEFVRTGPFRFMRHPVYFSMILELLAFTLLCRAWVTLVIGVFLFTPILLRRLSLEEKAMVNKFGDAYREYQNTTPAVIPWP